MDMRFAVHSVAEQPIAVKAEYLGNIIDASIRGLVVELVSDDGVCFTPRLPINTDADMDAARALFIVGATLNVSITPVSEDQP